MNYVIETYCVLCTVKANKCVQNHRTKNSVVLYKHDSPPLPIFELSLKLLTLEKILNSFLVIESSFKSSSLVISLLVKLEEASPLCYLFEWIFLITMLIDTQRVFFMKNLTGLIGG